MARFFGKIGYASTGTLVDDVWTDTITERDYYGDILEATRSLEPSDKVKDDIRLQNRLSIVADAFALENFSKIKYAIWNGNRWTVTNVTIERPRLILSLGGVYNGETP